MSSSRLLTRFAFDLSEKIDEPLRHCRMSENRVAQCREQLSSDHRGLNGGHQLARLYAERSEADNFVAVSANQHLHETTRFGNRVSAEHIRHRHFCDSI